MQSVIEEKKDGLDQQLIASEGINDQTSEVANEDALQERYRLLYQAGKNLLLLAAAAGIGISTYHYVSEDEMPFTSSDNNQLLYNIMLGLSAMGILGITAYQCRQPNSFFQDKNNAASDINLLNGIPVQHEGQDYIIKAIGKPTEDPSSNITYLLGIKVKDTDTDFVVDEERAISLTLPKGEAEKITTIEDVLKKRNDQNSLNYDLETLIDDLKTCLQQTNPINS